MKEVHYHAKYLCTLLKNECLMAIRENREEENNENVRKIMMILACGSISPR